MEEYNSKIETLKHIKQVALYISRVQDALLKDDPIKSGINDITLVDMLKILLDGNDLPSFSKLFNDINKNSHIYKLGTKYYDQSELLTL